MGFQNRVVGRFPNKAADLCLSRVVEAFPSRVASLCQDSSAEMCQGSSAGRCRSSRANRCQSNPARMSARTSSGVKSATMDKISTMPETRTANTTLFLISANLQTTRYISNMSRRFHVVSKVVIVKKIKKLFPLKKKKKKKKKK